MSTQPSPVQTAPDPQVQQFAATIRAKFPGAYDDLDDTTLATKVVSKYPQYSDMLPKGFAASQPGAYQTAPGAPIQNSLANDAGLTGQQDSEGEEDQTGSAGNGGGSLLDLITQNPEVSPFVGAAKSAGQHAYNLANLTNAALTKALPFGERYIPKQTPAPQSLQPQGFGQKAGALAEDMGEYYLPTEGLSAAAELSPLAKAAEEAPGLAADIAREAGGAGAVSGAQGEGFTSGAVYGGAVPVASKLLTPATKALAERAPGLVNSLIKPSKALKRFTNPGAAVVNEGIIARSLPDLAGQLSDKVAEYGDLINAAMTDPAVSGKTQDARPLVEGPINDMIQKVANGKQEGGQPLIDRLNELMDQLTKERGLDADGKLVVTGDKDLTLNPENLNAMKRTLGGAYQKTGLPYDAPVNQVKREIYQNLKSAAAEAVPEVGPLNASETGLIAAMKAAENRAGVAENAAPISLADIAAAGVGNVPGFALKRAAGSTLGTTLLAQGMHQAPTAAEPSLRLLRAFLLARRGISPGDSGGNADVSDSGLQ